MKAILVLVSILVAAPVRAELVLKPRGGSAVQIAPLVSSEVEIQVTAHVARAKVTQRFRNPHADWYEGTYVFPLPENAAVDRLRMRIGDRLVEGEIRGREEAKATYAQAKAEGRRASLIEQERPNIFTSSVANIGPGDEIGVEIEYQQTLRYDQGRYSLRFPMVVGPRYLPARMDPEDAARISPAVLRPSEDAPLHNPVTLRVDLQAGVPLAELASPSHPIHASCDRAGCRAGLQGQVAANKDFVLNWTLAQNAAPAAAAITEKKGERYYGLVMVVPPAAQREAQRLPREVIYVIDTSGSMQGSSISQAREALELAIRRLAADDRFNVIEFNSYARPLYREARHATANNVQAAVRWVRELRAQGGTEMAKALDLALDGRETPGRVRQIVFLTDGAVGNEDELFRMIRARLGDSRLFTVGIGSAPNSHFMTKAAQLGAGSFTYIGRIEEVKEKMDALFAKLESPVLKGVRIDWGGVQDIVAWPKQIPDLYAGEPVMVSFSAEKLPREVTVSALAGDSPWQAWMPVAAADGKNALSVLWAREQIAALMDRMREGAPESEIREAVMALALEHHLVSRYTSLVAVDKTPARTAEALLKSASIATNLPEGWTYEGVFGELPRGATSLRLDLLLGTLLLLFAGLLWRRARG
jgi:Ca-activated chloride channel family protein